MVFDCVGDGNSGGSCGSRTLEKNVMRNKIAMRKIHLLSRTSYLSVRIRRMLYVKNTMVSCVCMYSNTFSASLTRRTQCVSKWETRKTQKLKYISRFVSFEMALRTWRCYIELAHVLQPHHTTRAKRAQFKSKEAVWTVNKEKLASTYQHVRNLVRHNYGKNLVMYRANLWCVVTSQIRIKWK